MEATQAWLLHATAESCGRTEQRRGSLLRHAEGKGWTGTLIDQDEMNGKRGRCHCGDLHTRKLAGSGVTALLSVMLGAGVCLHWLPGRRLSIFLGILVLPARLLRSRGLRGRLCCHMRIMRRRVRKLTEDEPAHQQKNHRPALQEMTSHAASLSFSPPSRNHAAHRQLLSGCRATTRIGVRTTNSGARHGEQAQDPTTQYA